MRAPIVLADGLVWEETSTAFAAGRDDVRFNEMEENIALCTSRNTSHAFFSSSASLPGGGSLFDADAGRRERADRVVCLETTGRSIRLASRGLRRKP